MKTQRDRVLEELIRAGDRGMQQNLLASGLDCTLESLLNIIDKMAIQHNRGHLTVTNLKRTGK